MVITPDRWKTGTNALLVRPPGLIDYAYGPGSFQRHLERARAFGIRVEVCEIPSIGLDLDLPEDLDMIRQMKIL
jgi:2-phospho-L-lactate guanylyltransferase